MTRPTFNALEVNKTFRAYLARLQEQAETLLQCVPRKVGDGLPPNMPTKGIYLFSSGKAAQYVGRSDNIRRRMGLHTRPSAGHNQATLAFHMARATLGLSAPSYKPHGSRAFLLKNRRFRTAFDQAKLKIRNMDVRFLEEPDPIMQALLEIYVSTALRTPYNEFKTS